MKLLLAPNAFKGSLSAVDVAEALARGALRAAPGARLDLMPISDGGDGLLDALLACRGRKVFAAVTGPLGEKRWASFALLPGRIAVIEMAQASGLALLPEGKRDIWNSTSYGTGELMLRALDAGARTLWVGMGGSATNDAGAGLAQALGARLLDADGREIARGAAGLRALARVDVSGMDKRLRRARVIAVSDVTNPLLGPRGSARVFGPQKGASPRDIPLLEAALKRYAGVLRRDLGVDAGALAGSGAAGGLGAGLAAFVHAALQSGAALVLEELSAAERVAWADLVITGEGRLDSQSLYGKAPVALADLARSLGRPVAAVCGSLEGAAAARLKRRGITRVIALTDSVSEARALRETPRLLARVAERLVNDHLKGL